MRRERSDQNSSFSQPVVMLKSRGSLKPRTRKLAANASALNGAAPLNARHSGRPGSSHNRLSEKRPRSPLSKVANGTLALLDTQNARLLVLLVLLWDHSLA